MLRKISLINMAEEFGSKVRKGKDRYLLSGCRLVGNQLSSFINQHLPYSLALDRRITIEVLELYVKLNLAIKPKFVILSPSKDRQNLLLNLCFDKLSMTLRDISYISHKALETECAIQYFDA